MTIERIATRFVNHPYPKTSHVPIEGQYRKRWWLPVVGPTATCLLDLLADDIDSSWRTHQAVELSAALGLGARTGASSPLIRTMNRLTQFGVGEFDIAPGEGPEPCLSVYRTVPLIPQRSIAKWPEALQVAHGIDLAERYRQAS